MRCVVGNLRLHIPTASATKNTFDCNPPHAGEHVLRIHPLRERDGVQEPPCFLCGKFGRVFTGVFDGFGTTENAGCQSLRLSIFLARRAFPEELRNRGIKKGSSSGSWFRSKNPCVAKRMMSHCFAKKTRCTKISTICGDHHCLWQKQWTAWSLAKGPPGLTWQFCWSPAIECHHWTVVGGFHVATWNDAEILTAASLHARCVQLCLHDQAQDLLARFDLTTLSWWKKHQVPGDSIRDLFGSPGRWRSLIERHTLFTPKKVTIA